MDALPIALVTIRNLDPYNGALTLKRGYAVEMKNPFTAPRSQSTGTREKTHLEVTVHDFGLPVHPVGWITPEEAARLMRQMAAAGASVHMVRQPAQGDNPRSNPTTKVEVRKSDKPGNISPRRLDHQTRVAKVQVKGQGKMPPKIGVSIWNNNGSANVVLHMNAVCGPQDQRADMLNNRLCLITERRGQVVAITGMAAVPVP